jgi:HK97 gp10 family phage protein
MGIDIKIEGIEKTIRKLKRLPEETLITELHDILNKCESGLINEMRSRAPVDTGLLRGDIETLSKGVGKKGMIVNVGVKYGHGKANHAHFQEFGTRFHGAQPFMRPAADIMRIKAAQYFTDGLNRAIEKVKR